APPPACRAPPGGAGGPAPDAEAGGRARRASRDRGRFTRNFVVQASAADWALVLLAAGRPGLAGPRRPARPTRPHLVFFQHDEVMVHCPRADADRVAGVLADAADESGRLVFGDTSVRFPLAWALAA